MDYIDHVPGGGDKLVYTLRFTTVIKIVQTAGVFACF